MGREGAASQMKNHEGYHDPTAGKAIPRVDSSKFRRRTSAKLRRLTYQSKRRARGSEMRHPLTYKVGDLPRCICTLLAEQTKRVKVCRI